MVVSERDRKKKTAARIRATAGLVAALLALAICLVGMPVVSSLSARPLPTLPAEAKQMIIGPKGKLNLRNVPIFDSASAPSILGTGEGLEDPAKVYAAADALLARLGSAGLVSSLWSALRQEEVGLGSVKLPYDYRLTRQALAPALRPGVLASHRKELNQLASLMFLAAAHENPGSGTAVAHGAAAAYVIWAKLAQSSPDCDTQLNLAVLVSMGQFTPIPSIDAVFEAADTSCKNDPTLLWYWAMSTASTDSWREWDADIDTRYERSRQIISRLAKADQALANAASGYLELTMGGPPFVARAHASRAAQYFSKSLSDVDDPLTRWGLASALAQQGRYADAVASAMDLLGESAAWNVVPTIVKWAELSGEYASGTKAADLLTVETSKDGSAPAVAFQWAPISLRSTNVMYVWDMTAQGIGGAGGHDLWIIPYTRELPIEVGAECPEVAQAMLHLLGGQADRSARQAQADDPWYCNRQVLAVMQEVQLGDVATAKRLLAQSQGASAILEAAQDRWRVSREWSKAGAMTAIWRSVDPEDPAAWDRSGEVAFNQGDFAGARDFFQEAARLLADSQDGSEILREGDSQFDIQQQRTIEAIKLGVTEARLGDTTGAKSLLSKASLVKEEYGSVVAHSAWTQLGDLDMATSDWEGAITAYSNAVNLIKDPFTASDGAKTSYVWAGNAHGMQENNLALALYKVGRSSEAEVMARKALEWDPANPIYLDTAAFVLQGTDHERDAIAVYQRALEFDPTLFEAWNNLGVLLVHSGESPEAIGAFRMAVGLRPGYASGWHNLGTALSIGTSFQHFVESQGALARATLLDRAYSDSEPSVAFDEMIYDSGLDVSKPIPANWALATAAREPLHPFTLLMAILLGLSLVAAAFKDQLSGKVWEGLVARTQKLKVRIPGRLPVAVGIIAAVLVELWCLPSGSGGPWWMLSIGLGTAALVGLVPSLRTVMGRGGDAVHQFSWSPFLAVSVLGGLLGLGFSPMSAMTDGPTEQRTVRLWGLIGLGAGVCVAIGSTLVSGNPIARLLALVGIASWGAQVFPIAPMDGAHLSKWWSLTLTVVAAGASLLFVVPLL